MPDASYQFEDFGLELRWAAASMRGMTGSSEVKPNQDAASCMAPLGPNASTAFFGIFDGHGDGGEKPAAYAAQRVSPVVAPSPFRQQPVMTRVHCSRILTISQPSPPDFWTIPQAGPHVRRQPQLT